MSDFHPKLAAQPQALTDSSSWTCDHLATALACLLSHAQIEMCASTPANVLKSTICLFPSSTEGRNATCRACNMCAVSDAFFIMCMFASVVCFSFSALMTADLIKKVHQSLLYKYFFSCLLAVKICFEVRTINTVIFPYGKYLIH